MESLVLKNVDTGRETEVKADGLFLFVGMVPQTELVKDMVDCDKAGYIREFDTLKSKKVPQSLEIGLFFVKFLFLLYSNI